MLRDEVVSLFASVPPGVVVDATTGGGGHAAALLHAYPTLASSGMDRDPAALAAARDTLAAFGDRVTLVQAPFSALASVVTDAGLGALSGVLFDLGVSSPQLDVAGRGFSYRQDGPLDMRMDPTAAVTAADLVNEMPDGRPGRAVRGERRGSSGRAHRPRRRAGPSAAHHRGVG